jgi:hypothetical protein
MLSVCFQFTIPSGYPPPDKGIRDWLLFHKYHDQKETAEWLRGFLHALLYVMLENLMLLEGGVILYDHSDSLEVNSCANPQGCWTPLMCQNLTSLRLKFENAIVNWRFIFAAT